MKNIDKKNSKKGRKFVQILGINVISTSMDAVLASVKDFVSHNNKFYIVTPNPELVLIAQENKALKGSLNGADLPVPDGVGLKLAFPNLPIIKGRELFNQLVNLASRNKWRIFFLGGLGNEAEIAAKKAGARFARGPKLDRAAKPLSEVDRKREKETIVAINKFAPHLLFVAFGNPRQEIWIHRNLPRLKIGGAMAVGGSFRYMAGMVPLPPEWMDKLGLEWLWRLLTEPFRMGRIWNAVIIFPLRVFLAKKTA